MFSKLPCLANLEDPVFQSEVQDIINNREDLQKYLLATGDLSDSIQESLDLVVSNSRLNDGTAVSHEFDLNPATKFFKQNNDPFDVVYRKQAKFDVQNRIIGTLLEQIDTSKIMPSGVKKVLD